MIWALLQSESPWQRSNAIYVFCLSLCFSVRRNFVPAIIASIMASIMMQTYVFLLNVYVHMKLNNASE